MGVFAKWTEIESLGHVPEILSSAYVKEVVVTEKIHGTSVRFGVVDGIFRVGGRNEEFDFEKSNAGAGMGFLGWLRQTQLPTKTMEFAVRTCMDIIFYGEWFGSGIQKGIKYFTDGKGFRVFGVRIGEEICEWDRVAVLSSEVGAQTVPVFYRGVPSLGLFDGFCVASSLVAKENGIDDPGNLVEGVVVSAIPLQRIGNTWLIAKHKNPKFAERASEQRKPKIPDVQEEEVLTHARYFVEEFWTPQRLEHVLTYLREKGMDIRASQVIGPAIKGMFEDVMKEGQPEWQILSDMVKSCVGKMHPTYTKRLLEAYWREWLEV